MGDSSDAGRPANNSPGYPSVHSGFGELRRGEHQSKRRPFSVESRPAGLTRLLEHHILSNSAKHKGIKVPEALTPLIEFGEYLR